MQVAVEELETTVQALAALVAAVTEQLLLVQQDHPEQLTLAAVVVETLPPQVTQVQVVRVSLLFVTWVTKLLLAEL
jgi:archaellum component FlaC